jgi:MraZ protein
VLIGEHTHTLDEKSRLSLPSKFRSEMGKRVVVAPGIDGCLFVFTGSEWKKFADRLSRPDSSSSVLQSDNRNFNRLIIGRAVETQIDSIGRILIPEHLVSHASLKTKAVILGLINRVEIWNADVWENHRKTFEKKTEAMADKLNSAGII